MALPFWLQSCVPQTRSWPLTTTGESAGASSVSSLCAPDVARSSADEPHASADASATTMTTAETELAANPRLSMR